MEQSISLVSWMTMSRPTEHLAIAFANTLSSRSRDRIASPDGFASWASGWPTLSRLAVGLPESTLAAIRTQRDATQQVLHRLAAHQSAAREPLELVTRPGLSAAPFRLVVDGATIRVDGEPEAALRHLLGRAMVDLLLGPLAGRLRQCAGTGCRKVFLAQRADRRWCDSQICGNRARVAAHAHRRSAATDRRAEP